ncbi:OPT superfamily [Sorochytrium milnesiophthora]
MVGTNNDEYAVDKDQKKELDVESLGDSKGLFVVDQDYEDNIKALLPTTDDVNIPSLTFRVWLLGTIMCLVMGYINQLLTFRNNATLLNPYLAVLLSYPIGRFLAAVLPTARFHLPLLGECSLNPGPYSAKETILIYIMASTGAGGIYGTDNLFVQKYYYNMDIGAWAGIGFLLATMLSGFGIAGVLHRYLVRPAHMMWPSALPQIALVRSFHQSDYSDKDPNVGENGRRHMSRLRFFGLALLGMSIYEVIPTVFAPALQGFGILCLFSTDRVLQMVSSPILGVGALSFGLDWNYIGGVAINYPWWVQVNSFVGTVILAWIITPLAWRYNWLGNPPLVDPLNTVRMFNSTGDAVGATDLVDPTTHTLMLDAYEAQKPFWIGEYFAITYMTSFTTFAAALSHTIAWYGKDIWARFRASRYEEDDIHCQLIDKYPQVPRMWYNAVFMVPAVLGIVVCHFTDIKMPWYLSLLSIVMSLVVSIPFSLICAITGTGLATNVISEFLVGTIYTGHPIVMMAFKCLSVTVCGAVMTLLQDLKVGHYMKIAPRHVFISQLYSQVISVLICYASLQAWVANPIHVQWVTDPDTYANDAVASKWSSQSGYETYYNASLIWGAIGPVRFFFASYTPLVIGGFLLGFLMPVATKLAHEYIGGPIPWALINAPIMTNIFGAGSSQAGPLPSIITSFIFQYLVYRYRTKWWQRYNYVMSVAFDVAIVIVNLINVYALADYSPPHWALNPTGASDLCPNVTPDKVVASS